MKRPGVKEDYWTWFILGLILLLGIFTNRILTLLTPVGVLGFNFAFSLVLYQLIHPDIGFLALLWLGIVGIYLSQMRCIRKFDTEKKRWVGEVERRLKMLEGT